MVGRDDHVGGDLTDEMLFAYTLADQSRDADKDIDQVADTIVRGAYGRTRRPCGWLTGANGALRLHAGRRGAGLRKDIDLEAPTQCDGRLSDETTVWVADAQVDKIYAYTMDGTRDSAKDFGPLAAAGNNRPLGIWSDETTMWVVDTDDDKVYAYNMLPS